jgi:ribosomal protein S18 acetylase RimI-like enzyme
MIFREAVESDLQKVFQIYKKAVRHMNVAGIFQWDDTYPAEDDLRTDIEKGTMYLCIIENAIAAAFVASQDYDCAYEQGDWHYDKSSSYVVHRLCVNPAFQRLGIGTHTMIFAESLLKEKGVESIRLDAFSKNPIALRLYEKLGYIKVGEVQFRKGLFYLFEKKL